MLLWRLRRLRLHFSNLEFFNYFSGALSAFTTPSISVDECWFDNQPTIEQKPQIFSGRIFVVEFPTLISFKEKTQLKNMIISHGGTISHMLNKKVSYDVHSIHVCLIWCANNFILSKPGSIDESNTLPAVVEFLLVSLTLEQRRSPDKDVNSDWMVLCLSVLHDAV